MAKHKGLAGLAFTDHMDIEAAVEGTRISRE